MIKISYVIKRLRFALVGLILPLTCLIRKKKNDVYIVLSSAVGDIVYAMCYIDEIVRKTLNNNGKVYIICVETKRDIVESYSAAFTVITLSPFSYKWKLWEAFIQVHILAHIFAKFKIYSLIPAVVVKSKDNKGISGLDIVRRQLFGVDEIRNIKLSYPYIRNNKVVSIPSFEERYKKIVVINPYSRSMSFYDSFLFEKIAERLVADGYNVYTNVIGSQLPVHGTEPLRCSIFEFYNICNYIPLVVSVRTGLLDYCVNTKASKFIYYFNLDKKGGIGWYHTYTLKAWREDIGECIHHDTESAYKEFEQYYHQL